jgi:hypothetical protein
VFTVGVLASFDGFGEAVDARVRAAEASAAVPSAPATTWTYLVNDDPFRHTMGTLLTAAGGPTIAIYAAVFMAPLLVAWGVADRWWLRRRRQGSRLCENRFLTVVLVTFHRSARVDEV